VAGAAHGPLRLLLAAPYLVFALRPALPIAVAAVVLASVGYSACLLLQQRLTGNNPWSRGTRQRAAAACSRARGVSW
jgi:hypothetical protein